MNFPATLIVFSTLAAAASAQNLGGLLYSTKYEELSNQCSTTPGLNRVRPSSLEYVEPVPHPVAGLYPYAGKAYMPTLGYNTVAGDVDGDAQYFDPTMLGGIDAILHPRYISGGRVPLDKSRVFISPKQVTTDLAGTPLRPGDVGRLRPFLGSHGEWEVFLHEQDVRAAFGIPGSATVDVDAVCVGRGVPGAVGFDVILSLEGTVPLNIASWGSITVQDGAILMIPSWAIFGWSTSFDGAATISLGGIIANSGQILAIETDVDSWVGNSNIGDSTGAAVSTVGDVDGLTLDPDGGVWQSTWYTSPIPNLMFSGENLTGAGIVSTRFNGSIGNVGWVPMGMWAPWPSTGAHVGLITSPVRSLAGLAMTRPQTSHFTMDTDTERLTGPGFMTVEVGGADPSGPVAILIDLGAVGASGFDTANWPFTNPDFPMLYPMTLLTWLPVSASGCATWTLPVSPFMFGLLSGISFEFQAFQGPTSGTGTPHLSNPIRVEFY